MTWFPSRPSRPLESLFGCTAGVQRRRVAFGLGRSEFGTWSVQVEMLQHARASILSSSESVRASQPTSERPVAVGRELYRVQFIICLDTCLINLFPDLSSGRRGLVGHLLATFRSTSRLKPNGWRFLLPLGMDSSTDLRKQLDPP